MNTKLGVAMVEDLALLSEEVRFSSILCIRGVAFQTKCRCKVYETATLTDTLAACPRLCTTPCICRIIDRSFSGILHAFLAPASLPQPPSQRTATLSAPSSSQPSPAQPSSSRTTSHGPHFCLLLLLRRSFLLADGRTCMRSGCVRWRSGAFSTSSDASTTSTSTPTLRAC